MYLCQDSGSLEPIQTKPKKNKLSEPSHLTFATKPGRNVNIDVIMKKAFQKGD